MLSRCNQTAKFLWVAISFLLAAKRAGESRVSMPRPAWQIRSIRTPRGNGSGDVLSILIDARRQDHSVRPFYGLSVDRRVIILPGSMPLPASLTRLTRTRMITVHSIALLADGKILVGGCFTNIGGQARNLFARLTNDIAALQCLDVTQTNITWTCGGSARNSRVLPSTIPMTM